MSESDAEYFARLGQRFAEAQDRMLEPHDARAAVRERLFGGQTRASSVRLASAPPRWRWSLVPAVALVAGALLVAAAWRYRGAPITFDVGGSVGQTGQLTLADEAPVPLRFSDGSWLELSPRSRSRVLEVEHNGARVELERGSVRASVVHRADTAWTVLAGPFEVAVTGTKFVTRWDPQARELEVTVQEGSVLVSGGTLRVPERVTGGKTLRVSLAASALQSLREKASSQPPAPPAPLASREPAPKPPSSAAKASPNDSEAFRAVFESGSPTDLVTLSKELRQRGDLRGAARALSALRARFPGDPRSALAARTLSEIALARRDCGEARRWLETYRAQAPAGTVADELFQRVQACGGPR